MSRRRSTRTDRLSRGFTLVELTVALVAGLIVGMGIVSLSREATRTFHEEIRSSAAEAALRTAVDRLRADLQRASYMSTGNIVSDPRIAHAPGAANVAGISATMSGILRLAGIRLLDGASAANTPLSGAQQPALAPDAIEIGGNMTSADQFEIESIQNIGGACNRIFLASTSPAVLRVMAVGPQAQATELNDLFQPSPNGQFIVRMVDDTGRSQYLATCAETPVAGFASPTQPYVDVDSINTPLRTAQSTQTLGGVTATPGGRAFVNPVQIVHWEITSAALEPAQYRNALAGQSLVPGATDPNKYDLVRWYVDALGNAVPATTEVVAEYAVDLDFAFTVESGFGPFQPATQTFAFDDPANAAWAGDVSVPSNPPAQPERIRVVRARLATRAAQADRVANLPAPVGDYGGAEAFLFRYCLVQPCTTPPPNDGLLRWARVRTITTEVSLPNQAGDFY